MGASLRQLAPVLAVRLSKAGAGAEAEAEAGTGTGVVAGARLGASAGVGAWTRVGASTSLRVGTGLVTGGRCDSAGSSLDASPKQTEVCHEASHMATSDDAAAASPDNTPMMMLVPTSLNALVRTAPRYCVAAAVMPGNFKGRHRKGIGDGKDNERGIQNPSYTASQSTNDEYTNLSPTARRAPIRRYLNTEVLYLASLHRHWIQPSSGAT